MFGFMIQGDLVPPPAAVEHEAPPALEDNDESANDPGSDGEGEGQGQEGDTGEGEGDPAPDGLSEGQESTEAKTETKTEAQPAEAPSSSRRRARQPSGQFQADDPTTTDRNEAFSDGQP